MRPIVTRREDGTFSMLFLPKEWADLLLEIPEIMARDDRPEVKSRLYPDPMDDEEFVEDWKRLMQPELFALIAGARQIMLTDLEMLERTRGHPAGGRLDIPAKHRAAWISGLNAARLVLGTEHAVDADAMEDVDAFTREDDKSVAIQRIHLLGELQGVLIEEEQAL